jgi:hypothetical protein
VAVIVPGGIEGVLVGLEAAGHGIPFVELGEEGFHVGNGIGGAVHAGGR